MSRVVKLSLLCNFIVYPVWDSLFPFSWLFKCLYFLANLAARLMCLLWKLAERFCSIFSKYCLCLWWILGFLGFLTFFFFKVYSSMRWSSEVCLWIQRKDLNLTDGSRCFAAAANEQKLTGVCRFPDKYTMPWDAARVMKVGHGVSRMVQMVFTILIPTGRSWLCGNQRNFHKSGFYLLFGQQHSLFGVAQSSLGGCIFGGFGCACL